MKSDFTQIFFARPPVAGRVKTRLAEYLGKDRACDLYIELLRRSVYAFAAAEVDMVVYSSEEDDRKQLAKTIQAALPERYPSPPSVRLQSGADLGERMARALRETAARNTKLENAPDRLLLAGTDIPAYQPESARQAAKLLESYDAVLGPASDGGYYMIGLRAEHAQNAELMHQVFAKIPWSTDRVFEIQRKRLRNAGLSVAEAPLLDDLDTFDDLLQLSERYAFEFLRGFLPDVRVILPIWNEADNLKFVLRPLFASKFFREIICADNGSDDGSRKLAADLGARVTLCEERGYGATCLTALDDIRERGGCDVVLFMDGDGADDPASIPQMLAPVTSGRFDLVLGARNPDLAAPGSLLPHQRFGNWLITRIIAFLWKHEYADLGPFRAVRWEALEAMEMDDRNYGWTVQMQTRALDLGLRVLEMPVPYRKRHAGKSKVTATIRGSYLAGKIIFRTIFREWRRRREKTGSQGDGK